MNTKARIESALNDYLEKHTHYRSNKPMSCPRCGSDKTLRLEAPPPHAAKLVCEKCNRWLKWLSKSQLKELGGLSQSQTSLFG